MAFDYEKLMESAEDYGLDAAIRAIAGAAYQQGLADGIQQGDHIEGTIDALSEAVAALRVSFKNPTNHIHLTALENAARALDGGSKWVQPAGFGSGSAALAADRNFQFVKPELHTALTTVGFPRAYASVLPSVGLNVDDANSRHAAEPPTLHRVRVARGLVRDTVAMALELEPGKSIKEYEALVLELEPDISIKSIGNELRRGEADGRYKRDRSGGYRWYLGSHKFEAADHVADDAAASHSIQGGNDEPDNMT